MIEHIMKKLGDELRVNPKIEYSPTTKFKASVPDISLRDLNGKHISNYAHADNPEKAMIMMWNTLKASLIQVHSYPKDEEYAYIGNRFERVHKVEICIGE